MNQADLNKFSVTQLKRWLSALGVPTQGIKAKLMARPGQIPSEQRGQAPEEEASQNAGKDHPGTDPEIST